MCGWNVVKSGKGWNFQTKYLTKLGIVCHNIITHVALANYLTNQISENNILDALTLFHRGEDQENISDSEDITLWLISMCLILFILLVLFLHYRVIY